MRCTVHVALVHVVVLWAAWMTPNAAWATPPTLEQIAVQLSGIEAVPEPQALVDGGAATASLLIALYRDATQPTVVRARALRLLSYFGAEIARPTLTEVMRSEHAKPVFVREAALGLCRCAGSQATALVAAMLQEHDPQRRRIAVEALRTLATAASRQALLRHRDHETDINVRRALDASLDATRLR